MRLVAVVAGDGDDDVDCADQSRSCSFTTLSHGGRPRNNDDAAHSRSVVGESGAAEGGDIPSPQNPNGALSLLLSIHSQHLLGSDPIRRFTLHGCDAQ